MTSLTHQLWALIIGFLFAGWVFGFVTVLLVWMSMAFWIFVFYQVAGWIGIPIKRGF